MAATIDVETRAVLSNGEVTAIAAPVYLEGAHYGDTVVMTVGDHQGAGYLAMVLPAGYFTVSFGDVKGYNRPEPVEIVIDEATTQILVRGDYSEGTNMTQAVLRAVGLTLVGTAALNLLAWAIRRR